MKVRIGDLMETSGVKFGTSGARGEVVKMTDFVCYAYTMGFLQYLMSTGEIEPGDKVVVAGDLRPSTDRIMTACNRAASDMGFEVVNGGKVPSPASAYYGLVKGMPVIMVTGSHIPDDRNGIKFNKIAGEVLKSDEQPIKDQVVGIPADLFDEDGFFVEGASGELPAVEEEVRHMFIKRYIDVFPSDSLAGLRIGLYQHSAVGRDMFLQVLTGLGADVTPLGRSDKFVPVDTEDIRTEDEELARGWAAKYGFDAIVSTDGDSDRPLITGRDGEWQRGDVLGIMAAWYLGADSVSCPISCNSALEKSKLFPEEGIRRTKIGSPYVVKAMMEAERDGFEKVVSYEANGGFLTQTDFTINGKTLRALPTRDAFLPIIAALLLARREGKKDVEGIRASLPQRFTWSGGVPIPTEKGLKILKLFDSDDEAANRKAAEAIYDGKLGEVEEIVRIDGRQFHYSKGDRAMVRPSGNEPKTRGYSEAETKARAAEVGEGMLDFVRNF